MHLIFAFIGEASGCEWQEPKGQASAASVATPLTGSQGRCGAAWRPFPLPLLCMGLRLDSTLKLLKTNKQTNKNFVADEL